MAFNKNGLLLDMDGNLAEYNPYVYYDELGIEDLPDFDEYVSSREYLEQWKSYLEDQISDIKENGIRPGQSKNALNTLEKELKKAEKQLKKA